MFIKEVCERSVRAIISMPAASPRNKQTAYFVRVLPDFSMLVSGERLIVTTSTSRGSLRVYAKHNSMQVYRQLKLF